MNKKYLTFIFLAVMGVTLFAPCYNATNASLLPEGWKEDVGIKTEGAEQWNLGLDVNFAVKWAISGLIGGVAVILLLVTQAFMELSQILLTWVTSEGFISVKFTDNSFVNTGWEIVRDLTNILIVLGLVVIALATILRISSYQMKKTLPLLLIVALLINFTPMLCGLVIDASNIIMNHPLKAGQYLTQNYPSAIGSAISNLWNTMGSPSSMLATGLLLVGSSLFSGIIFLLYAFLFLFRYIALWMLVILSPIALFCYIFPATKKMWNMWLSQFIQWCFIGIPAAYSLYLANKMTEVMLQGELLGEISSMGKIMGYIVPVAFLAVGFFVSLQTGAMGASAITTRAKKGVIAMRKETTKIAGQPIRTAATGIQKIRGSYQEGIKSGLKPAQAIKNTATTWWETKVADPMKNATWKSAGNRALKIVSSPFKGSVNAAWDVGKAGAKAAFGEQEEEVRKEECPHCGKKKILKSANFCPKCGGILD